jgi:hypothetical protein
VSSRDGLDAVQYQESNPSRPVRSPAVSVHTTAILTAFLSSLSMSVECPGCGAIMALLHSQKWRFNFLLPDTTHTAYHKQKIFFTHIEKFVRIIM